MNNVTTTANLKIKGVNLGGWLVLERWITPTLFTGIPDQTTDEWGFCQFHGKQCQQKLRQHWDSWIKESDFEMISRIGLNLVRIPVGYWSFIPRYDEPFTYGANEYLVKALNWAKKYNLKVMIDLHGHPGSQNGFDNSGRAGPIEWFKQFGSYELSRDVLRQIVDQFIKPDRYKEVVHSIQFVNEPANWGLSIDRLKEFYSETYWMTQSIVPGLRVVFHDAFLGVMYWNEWIKQFPNAMIDTHIYHVFDKNKLRWNYQDHFNQVYWDEQTLWQYWLPSVVGEWSLATATCLRWEGDNCVEEKGWHEDTPEYNNFAKEFARRQIEAYTRPDSGFIFWCWKTEGFLEWDYQRAYNKGWFPNLRTNEYVKTDKVKVEEVGFQQKNIKFFPKKVGLSEHSKPTTKPLERITDTYKQVQNMDKKADDKEVKGSGSINNLNVQPQSIPKLMLFSPNHSFKLPNLLN